MFNEDSMFQFGGFPTGKTCDVKIFEGFPYSPQAIPQQWTKPPGVSMIWMMAVGGGAGGGGGFTRIAGAAGSGGGGGGSAGCHWVLIPALFVPDNLFLEVGIGGKGSTGSGVNGSDGGSSSIGNSYGTGTFGTWNSVPNAILLSGGQNASAGLKGSGTVVGAGGPANLVVTNAAQGWPYVFISSLAGGVGGAAGALAGGAGNASVNAPGAMICVGGGGGGSTTSADFAGGASTSAILCMPDMGGGLTAPGGAAGSFDGTPGVTQMKPFLSTGGGGGGASNAGVGGKGGDGAIGCGGGGGGSGTTGGAGGTGGPGIIIIISW